MTDRAPSERTESKRESQGLLVPMIVLLLSVGACSTMPPPADAVAPGTGPSAGTGSCNAEPVAWAVGREATAEVVERARRESGSATVRVIPPGQMVTMDYREDRLNVDTDARNAITRVRCG